MKNIRLYVNNDGYYGSGITIWTINGEGTDRKEFIKVFVNYFKQEEWLQKNMNVGEVMDFLQTLSNEINGDDLYNNLIENCYYLDSIHHKVYELDILNQYDKVVYPNKHYKDSDSISLFEELELTPYFKNNEDFKEWFLYRLECADEDLYTILCDDSKSREQLISVLKKRIEEAQKNKKYYEERLNECLEEIKKLEEKLKKVSDK